jgi:hypothetical protein
MGFAVLAAFASLSRATPTRAAGPEGCVVQSSSGGAAVGNPVNGTPASGAPSAPGAACAYKATVNGGWAGAGAVTVSYGTGTLPTGGTACTYATAPTVFTNSSGPFTSSSSLPGALGPIKAGDCVSVKAG